MGCGAGIVPGGVFCEALFEVALVDAGWVGEVLALTDGGADFLCVVQEAGATGGPHSGPHSGFCEPSGVGWEEWELWDLWKLWELWELWELWGGIDVIDVSDNGVWFGSCLMGSGAGSGVGFGSGAGASVAGFFLAGVRRLGWRERRRWRSVSMCAKRKTVSRRSSSSAGTVPVCT